MSVARETTSRSNELLLSCHVRFNLLMFRTLRAAVAMGGCR